MEDFIDEIKQLKKRIEELENRGLGSTLSVSKVKTDTIEEKTSGAGVSVNNILKVDNITEKTNNAGINFSKKIILNNNVPIISNDTSNNQRNLLTINNQNNIDFGDNNIYKINVNSNLFSKNKTSVVNLVLYSNDFTNGVWSGYCGTKTNLTTNQPDPFGGNTATKFTLPSVYSCGASSCWGVHYGGGVLTAYKSYVVSGWFRGETNGKISFGLNDAHMIDIDIDTTWRRYFVFFSYITNTSRGLQFLGKAANQIYYVCNVMLYEGCFACDYIPTTNSQVRQTVSIYF